MSLIFYLKILNKTEIKENMDPLENFCKIRDSFNSYSLQENKIEKYSENFSGSPRTRRNELLTDTKMDDIMEINIHKKKKMISSIFENHSSYVLANIDTIYNFSKLETGYLVQQVINENYKYAILDSDVGYLEYLQFRLPESIGFISKCLNNIKNEYKLNKSCDDKIINYIMNISPGGVDIVVSNTNDYKNNLIKALQICKPKGVFISKINNIDLQTLYITTLCFRQFSIFLPFLDDTIYVIAEDYIGNSLDIIPLLLQSKNIKVPFSFKNYINKSLQNIKPESVEYNLYKCKAIMNIP
jgi:hypothetical protein